MVNYQEFGGSLPEFWFGHWCDSGIASAWLDSPVNDVKSSKMKPQII